MTLNAFKTQLKTQNCKADKEKKNRIKSVSDKYVLHGFYYFGV